MTLVTDLMRRCLVLRELVMARQAAPNLVEKAKTLPEK